MEEKGKVFAKCTVDGIQRESFFKTPSDINRWLSRIWTLNLSEGVLNGNIDELIIIIKPNDLSTTKQERKETILKEFDPKKCPKCKEPKRCVVDVKCNCFLLEKRD